MRRLFTATFLLPRRRRQHVSPKRRNLFFNIHDVTYQKRVALYRNMVQINVFVYGVFREAGLPTAGSRPGEKTFWASRKSGPVKNTYPKSVAE
jgi:hypothetical protein